MRAIAAILVTMVSVGATHAAETYDDPKALVSAIYAAYQPGQPAGDAAQFYSKRLTALVDQHLDEKIAESDALMQGEAVPATAPFNPFMPDASALLFDLAIGEPTTLADHALINVSYHNFDQPRLLSIALVKEDGGWKVDDISAVGSEDHWMLSSILTYDPHSY
jgi:hypothetical protein